MGLYFKKSSRRDVETFTNANWTWSVTNRISTSTYCLYIRGNLVTWRRKKRPVVTRSDIEAEFGAIALKICEGIWLDHILKELRILKSTPIKCFVTTYQ